MRKKLFIILTLAVIMAILAVAPAFGQEVAGNSAIIRKEASSGASAKAKKLLKRKVMKAVLEQYNSPLVSAADSFMDACGKYDLDCYLLPSISCVESSFGKYLMPNSYNPFGWGGGYIYFESWSEGIDTVASGLRNNYVNRGADTVEKIGPIYAQSTTWSAKVRSFMNKFNQEEDKIRLYFEKNQLEF